MQQAKKGDKVKVHYHGKLSSGQTFDSSLERDPLEFELGGGTMIAGFDKGVNGMQVGEKKTITIPYDKAYGPRKADMVFEFPKEKFPADMTLEPGLQLALNDGQGNQLPVVITAIKENTVELDANHPLAGQDLVFELELVEIIGGSRIILPNT